MKVWEDKDGLVWYRGPEQGSVTRIDDWLWRRVDGKLQWATSPGCWQRSSGSSNNTVIRAIEKLWPPLTKVQLWRRVTRLAGELVFDGPDTEAFSVWCFQYSCLAMRELVKEARQWAIDIGPCKESRRCERRIAKLEAALAAWEAAT